MNNKLLKDILQGVIVACFLLGWAYALHYISMLPAGKHVVSPEDREATAQHTKEWARQVRENEIEIVNGSVQFK